MKLTLEQIVSDKPQLEKLCALVLPIKPGYRLSKLNRKLGPKVKEYERRRYSLVKQFGKLMDEKTNAYSVTPEYQDKFDQELEKLKAEEVEVDYDPISIESLEMPTIQPHLIIDWVFL